MFRFGTAMISHDVGFPPDAFYREAVIFYSPGSRSAPWRGRPFVDTLACVARKKHGNLPCKMHDQRYQIFVSSTFRDLKDKS